MSQESVTQENSLEERLRTAELRIKQLEETLYERVIEVVSQAEDRIEATRKNVIEENQNNRTYFESRLASTLKSLDDARDSAVDRVHSVSDEHVRNVAEKIRQSIVNEVEPEFLDQILRRALGSTVVKIRPATQNEIASNDTTIVITRSVS